MKFEYLPGLVSVVIICLVLELWQQVASDDTQLEPNSILDILIPIQYVLLYFYQVYDLVAAYFISFYYDFLGMFVSQLHVLL